MSDRDAALGLLQEWVSSPSLIEHSYAVEQVMRSYAVRYDSDPVLWGLAGLLHDLDFEKTPEPEVHGKLAADVLVAQGFDPRISDAILGHNLVLGVPRTTLMAKCLLACDELTGLIVAAAKMLPTKAIDQLRVESVIKKFKSPSFARGIDRAEINLGVEELGVEFKDHISFIIQSLTKVPSAIGLNVSAAA